MCGRYYVDDETAREIEKLVKDIDKKLAEKKGERDIHPSETARVICDRQDELTIRQQYWGFILPEGSKTRTETGTGTRTETGTGKGTENQTLKPARSEDKDKKAGSRIIFNARVESAFEKPMFAESIRNRRIIVPARGFYEWDRDKNKHTFTGKDNEVLYMAGIYKQFQGQERFVILTVPANALMEPVHDRMPLIMDKNLIKDWIFDEKSAKKLIMEASPRLEKKTEYEQQRLFFSDQAK